MRSGQSRCKTGGLRHLAEVARAAPVHHDCAMVGRIWHSARNFRRVRWSARRSWRRCSWCRTYKGSNWRLLPSLFQVCAHPGSQSSQGSGVGCVKRKKADASYHGQEMDQGGKTNEKVCEVWQVDLEASHRAALENGSLGAESLRYRGCGRAAIVDQAGANESC